MCVHSLILGWPDYGVVWRGSVLRVPMPEPEPLCQAQNHGFTYHMRKWLLHTPSAS